MITFATYITLFRLFLVAPIIYLIFNNYLIYACFCAAVAALTDILDGYIARRYHQESPLGAVLDPLADKLFVLGAITMLWYRSGTVAFWVVIFLWSKDMILGIGACALFLCGYRPVPARFSGKIAMVCQVAYVMLLLLTQYTHRDSSTWLTCILSVTVITTLYALIDYGKVGYRTLFHP